jgi:hypothetical protein
MALRPDTLKLTIHLLNKTIPMTISEKGLVMGGDFDASAPVWKMNGNGVLVVDHFHLLIRFSRNIKATHYLDYKIKKFYNRSQKLDQLKHLVAQQESSLGNQVAWMEYNR